MNASFKKTEIVRAVAAASLSAATRSSRPILQCVMLDVAADGASVRATDLEMETRATMETEYTQEIGSLCLPARELLSILKSCPTDSIRIVSDGNVARITSGDSAMALAGEVVADFPDADRSDREDAIEVAINTGTLRKMMTRALVSASRDLGRYAIDALQFEIAKEMLRIVSTDGRRLAVCEETPIYVTSNRAVRCLLPQSAARAFVKMTARVADRKSVARILVSRIDKSGLGLFASIAIPGARLSSTARDAEFPDYRGVMPNVEERARVDLASFLRAVGTAAVMSGKDAPCVALTFGEARIQIEGKTGGAGSAAAFVDARGVFSERKLAFNPVFLADLADCDLDSELAIELGAPGPHGNVGAVLFNGTQGFHYVVMPMSL